MNKFAWAVAFVLFTSFMTFVTFFGRIPALRHTPIGALHRLLWIHIPNFLLAVDRKLTSGKLSSSLYNLGNHLMHDRHWSIVALFLVIMLVSEYLYLPAAWPRIGWFTRFTAAITVILPYGFLWISCAVDPGYISADNLSYHMSLYPYDYALFHPRRMCSTCNLIKPPRSKHCSICKRCVAKSDHHCIFINGCVGYNNQRWFLLLLLSSALLTSYGGLLGLSLLAEKIHVRYPAWSVWPPATMSYKVWASYWFRSMQGDVAMGATSLLALLTSPLIWGLSLYTLYLIYCGTTTNESLKWSEWKEDMADGIAYRRPLPSHRDKADWGEPLVTRWSAEPKHIMVTTRDGKPPNNVARLPGEGEWERVRDLADVENVYDLGLWNNLRDTFMPDYPFDEMRWERSNGPRRRRKPSRTSVYPR